MGPVPHRQRYYESATTSRPRLSGALMASRAGPVLTPRRSVAMSGVPSRERGTLTARVDWSAGQPSSPAILRTDANGTSQVPRRSILCLCPAPTPRSGRRPLAHGGDGDAVPGPNTPETTNTIMISRPTTRLWHLLSTLHERRRRRPCKTRFRLAGSPLPGGSRTRWTAKEGFNFPSYPPSLGLPVASWAHLRRDFHDVWQATGSAIAKEALDQIGRLYDIERAINGQPAEVRLAVRQEKSRPIVERFRSWCAHQLERIPGKGDLAKAMRYALNRWEAFTLFLDDGRVAIDNNPAERALRPVCLTRKNSLFVGSDGGGQTFASAMTIIETAKLSGLNPEAYLADILARDNDHPNKRLDDLLPWNWQPLSA